MGKQMILSGGEIMDNMELAEKLEKIQLELERQDAFRACLGLMAKYQIYHHPFTAMGKRNIFAGSMPDVSLETGAMRQIGIDSIMEGQKLFTTAPLNGEWWLHPVTTPMIEVAGDGKTARGLFFSLGPEANREIKDGQARGYWSCGKYTVDFIKENGEWKIWHIRWWRMFKTGFDKSWTEPVVVKAPWSGNKVADKVLGGSQVKRHLEPSKFTKTDYNPDRPMACIPWFPEPYDTWHEGDEDWVYGPFKDFYLNPKPDEEIYDYVDAGTCVTMHIKDGVLDEIKL